MTSSRWFAACACAGVAKAVPTRAATTAMAYHGDRCALLMLVLTQWIETWTRDRRNPVKGKTGFTPIARRGARPDQNV
jgi:hypothetical protein